MEIIGITYNQIESGIYAVILQEKDGNRRVPIVIGESEAQAIQCKLQNLSLSRPLTHDLFLNTLDKLGFRLAGIEIYLMPSGVFASNLYIQGNGDSRIQVDSRASDAIALALRAGVPIFMEERILDEIGFNTRESDSTETGRVEESGDLDIGARIMNGSVQLNDFSDEELIEILSESIENEYYELSAKLRDELKNRGIKR